ncbi:DUF4221 domain-containing protein [Belliella sp. DSM 107340]|uniref:DUF4221 domain-containing protein n=1 Tax=Belliella calami TaxID=2923436 RepID=A0ABS9UR66_9BACT|nr:DUF4221 family protein [Belliella calami]MCH7399112.1 DUF4221 domain-containing protein [Belliella calami]
MRNLLLLIMFPCLIACSDKGADSIGKVYTNSFTEVGQVKLEIDTLSDFNFPEFQVIQDSGQEMLLVMNKVNFSFDFYDLISGEKVKRTVIQKEEKFPIRALYGFWYHNSDSIFLFNQMLLNGISLINGNGEILTQFNPQKVDRSSPQAIMKSMVNHYSRSANPTIYEKGKLHFSDMSLNGFLSSPEAMEAFRPAVEVDLVKNEVTLIDKIRLPSFYEGKSWPMDLGNFSRIRQGDLWIYSWSGMDSLLVFDENMDLIKSVNAKSEFAKPLKYTSGSNLPKDIQIQERVSQTTYSYIFYDAYREVYYRFVNIGRDMDEDDLEDQFPHLKNDFSIIVLDKDFNLLAEKRFPGKIHYPYKSFVGEKGLYLSRTNPFYEGINEDEVVFDVYEFN